MPENTPSAFNLIIQGLTMSSPNELIKPRHILNLLIHHYFYLGAL